MAYITKQIAGEYTANNDWVKSFFQKLRDFLLDNPIKKFQLVEENYDNSAFEKSFIKMKADGLTFKLSRISTGYSTQEVTVSYDTDGQENVTLTNYIGSQSISIATIQTSTDNSQRRIYRAVSNVFLASSNNSFIFNAQAINVKKLAPGRLWGVISYQDLNAKSNSFAFEAIKDVDAAELIPNSIDKTTGTKISLNVCHKSTNDTAQLVLENKVQVNQNNYWIGTSNDIVGLVPVTPIKAYQANSKKYIAIGTNVAFPIGQQIEV